MADRLGPRLIRPMGALSGALLAVSLGGAVLGVAPGSGHRTAASPFTAVAAARSASDAVRPGSAPSAPSRSTGHAGPAGPGGAVPATAADAAAVATAAGHAAEHPALARSTPIALALPSIGLTAPLLGLGMDSTGEPELPPFSQPRTAGWLRDSAAPGAAGTAVLVGHVDTRTGPAVFWGLSAVRPGAPVEVTRVDGSTALFTVDAVRVFDRTVFPAAQIYAPAKDAQLRIITCGGAFDRKRAEYTGNVVLFAHLSGVRPGAA